MRDFLSIIDQRAGSSDVSLCSASPRSDLKHPTPDRYNIYSRNIDMVSALLTVALGTLVALFLSKWLAYRKAAARIGNQPGSRLLFAPWSIFGILLPRIPLISPGPNFFWRSKRTVFDQVGKDIYGVVGVFPASSGYYVSDVDAIKQITAPRSAFKKNPSDYKVLTIFGSNLVTAEGSEWKRQRRICAPAFSDRNNKLVWATAMGYVDDIVSTWTKGEPVHVHDICEDITLPIALCVIAKAGYGQDVKWKDDDHPPPGHELTFKQALLTVSNKIFLSLIMPNWAWGLRKSWMDVKKANDELRLYLQEMVSTRREIQDMATRSLAKEKHDLFNQLVHAHDESDMLSEDELIGNAFIFLVAGHETTGHTLALVLALLALYPDEQTKLVEQIERARPKDRDFTYDDMPKLQYAMAVLYETLRMYPIVPNISKHAVSDTTLTAKSHTSHAITLLDVRALTPVAMLLTGLHYNPQYWDDPTAFVPARFMDPNWNRDAFISFSVGPRSCIGRRFAETTIVATLVAILSKYSVSADEMKFKSIPGESIIDRRERLIIISRKLTLTPEKVALVFTPRAPVA